MGDCKDLEQPMIRVSNRWEGEYRKAIDSLRKYREKVAEYLACKDLYDSMFPSATQMLTDMPRSPRTVFEPERWAERRIQQQEKMQQSLESMREEYLKIEAMIESLDGYEKVVIIKRYVQNKSFESIADEIHCHRNTAQCWHDKAIRHLAKTVQ